MSFYSCNQCGCSFELVFEDESKSSSCLRHAVGAGFVHCPCCLSGVYPK